MANSLRAKLSKLRHDGHITDAEYQAFIKKMDGHDREIRTKAIDECIKIIEETAWKDADMLVESIKELKEVRNE